MATQFHPRDDLDAVVARMIAGRMQKIADQVAEVARDLAPATKTWRTVGDPLVRPEHRAADGQEVPANLRFVLDSPDYDRHHYGADAQQQLRRPGDEDATPGLTVNCRCEMTVDPEGVARGIKAHQVRVTGSTVVGEVVCEGHRVVDAEFGTDKDDPARFMGRAVGEVARRTRRGR